MELRSGTYITMASPITDQSSIFDTFDIFDIFDIFKQQLATMSTPANRPRDTNAARAHLEPSAPFNF